MTLSGKTALVTGGGSGIGAAIALRLDQDLATVIVADVDADAAAEVARHLGQGRAVPMDVRDTASIDRVVTGIVQRWGPIHILVNSAGIFGLQTLLDVDAKSYDDLFAVNTRGTFFTLQAVARSMVEHSVAGSIVNVASQAGRRGEAASSVYAASKAAVISLTQSAALALIPHGIRVNAVAPGVVNTPLWARVDAMYAAQDGLEPGAYTERVIAQIPAGRLATPDDISGAVAFLAGDDSRYIVGQTINVDGGNVLS